MTCGKCGAELAEGSFYCEKCGARVEPDMTGSGRTVRMEQAVCPYCGRSVQADDVYCGFCGRELAAGEYEAAAGPEAEERHELVAGEYEAAVGPEAEERHETVAGPEAKETDTEPEAKEERPAAEVVGQQTAGAEKPEGVGPEAGETESEPEGAEPEAGETESESEGAEPEAGETESESEGAEPEAGETESESEGAEPEAEETEPEPEPEAGEEAEADPEGEPEPAAVPEGETEPAAVPEAGSEIAAAMEEKQKPAAAEKAAELLKRFSYLAPVAAGLVFLLVLTAFLRLFAGGRPEEAGQTRVIYYHEDALYLADLMTEEPPAAITDSCLDVGVPPYEGLVSGDRISRDGKWLYWREEFDGETFDLYRMSLLDGSAKEKLAAHVSSYQVPADENVLFERGGSLYYCKDAEPVRLGRDILFWQADREGKLVCWMEKTGEDGNACYLQALADGSEKVELDKNVTGFYASDSLSRFMSLKGGVLYLLDASGEKERIAQNVVSVESYDLDEGRFYYMTENPVRLAYTDVVRDDEGAMTEEDWLYVSDLGQFEVPYRQLRYHWPEGDSEVSGRCFLDSQDEDACVSEDGAYCIFREGPRIEDLKADWSEFKDRLEGGDFGTRLLETLNGNGQFSGLRLAAEGRTVNEYENAELPDGRESACYDRENRILYLFMTSDGEDRGTLYKVPLTGSRAGEPEPVDEEIDGIRSMTAADEGIYYIRDPGAYGGDLYFNGQEIAYDVSGMWMTDGQLAYIYDYDSDPSGNADFSLALYKDGEKTVVGKEILCADCAPDGTVVTLTDFDPLKGEGDLLYFDGKDTRMLAEEVTGFVPRNGSARIQ